MYVCLCQTQTRMRRLCTMCTIRTVSAPCTLALPVVSLPSCAHSHECMLEVWPPYVCAIQVKIHAVVAGDKRLDEWIPASKVVMSLSGPPVGPEARPMNACATASCAHAPLPIPQQTAGHDALQTMPQRATTMLADDSRSVESEYSSSASACLPILASSTPAHLSAKCLRPSGSRSYS